MTSLVLLAGVAWCLYRTGLLIVRVRLEDWRPVARPREFPWVYGLRWREVPGALLCLLAGREHRRALAEILHARAEARRPLYPLVPPRPLPPPGGWTASQHPYPVHHPAHLEAGRRRVTGGLERGMVGASAECSLPFEQGYLRPGVHQEKVWRPGRPVSYRWSVDMSGRCLCTDCKELRTRNSVAVPLVSQAPQGMLISDLFAAMEELTAAMRRVEGIPPPVVGDLADRDFTHHESRYRAGGCL